MWPGQNRPRALPFFLFPPLFLSPGLQQMHRLQSGTLSLLTGTGPRALPRAPEGKHHRGSLLWRGSGED